jgi:hypothetical protein
MFCCVTVIISDVAVNRKRFSVLIVCVDKQLLIFITMHVVSTSGLLPHTDTLVTVDTVYFMLHSMQDIFTPRATDSFQISVVARK